MSMLSLTAQFIDQNFELHKAVLHSREFSGSHTVEVLAAAFSNMFRAWGIPKEKVHDILRDNAKYMEKKSECKIFLILLFMSCLM